MAAIGAGFVDDPCIQLQKMVVRQNDLNRKRNEGISTYACTSAVENRRVLASGDETTADALTHLSSWGLEIWKREFKEASNYHLVQSLDEANHMVKRLDSEAPPRLVPKNGRCSCNARVSFLFPCSHEICVDAYRFVLFRVDQRWHKRTAITSSFAAGDDYPGAGDHRAGDHPSNDFLADNDGGVENDASATKGPPALVSTVTEAPPITHNENLCSQQTHNRNKGQEYNELMSIFQTLAQTAAGSKFGGIVGGIGIQLTQAIEGRANVDIGDGTWPSILHIFGKALETYRNAFSGKRNAAQPATNIGIPLKPLSQLGRPQRERLESTVESVGKKRKKNVVQTCGFCGSLAHQRQTSCPIMAALGTKILDKTAFLSYLIGNDAPCEEWGTRSEIVLKNVPTAARHIVVHRKFSTYHHGSGLEAPSLLHSIYKATVIEKSGLTLPNYDKVFFEGQAIIQFVSNCSKTKHVFSTIDS